MIIYSDPHCSKCREAIDLLEKNSCEFVVRDYLTIPPSVKEIEILVRKIGCSAEDLVRKTDSFFSENYTGKSFSEKDWVLLLVKHPQLLQRPIVIDGEKAVIGRPPVLVLDLIKGSSKSGEQGLFKKNKNSNA